MNCTEPCKHLGLPKKIPTKTHFYSNFLLSSTNSIHDLILKPLKNIPNLIRIKTTQKELLSNSSIIFETTSSLKSSWTLQLSPIPDKILTCGGMPVQEGHNITFIKSHVYLTDDSEIIILEILTKHKEDKKMLGWEFSIK